MADDLNNPKGSASDASTGATDMSQYIRTYAKDVAALTGKGNVGAIPTPKPNKKAKPAAAPVAAPQREVTDGVEFDATEQPFFERTEPKSAEMNYGPIDLGTKAEADAIVEQSRPSNVPVPATMQSASMIPPQAPAAPTEDKESILARLRTKVGTYTPPQPTPAVEATPEPIPAPEPVSYTPPAPVTPVPAPEISAPRETPIPAPQYREPIPEADVRTPIAEPIAVPAAARPQPVIPAPATPGDDRFHSYATDFGSQVATQAATPFAVIAAEQDRATPRPVAQSAPRKTPVLAIALGVVLLFAAAGGSYATYIYIASRHVVPTITTKVPSLVFADQTKKLNGNGAALMQELADAASEPLVTGNVLVTYIAQEPTGEPGVIAGAPAPGGALIKALTLSAPDILLRNIGEASTVGITHQGSETRAFFILRVSSYERTFAGMLTWEPLMARDLAALYPLYPADTVESTPVPLDTTGTSTTSTAKKAVATSTLPATPIPAASRIRFEDAIVSNRDVRVLRDTTGRSLILYGYADKETLIIARDEAAFSALITRLSSQSQ